MVHVSSQGCSREDVASKYSGPCCGFLFCDVHFSKTDSVFFNAFFDNKNTQQKVV